MIPFRDASTFNLIADSPIGSNPGTEARARCTATRDDGAIGFEACDSCFNVAKGSSTDRAKARSLDCSSAKTGSSCRSSAHD